ncbi:riboflavin synthase [Sediminibacterium sp.]|uniref:riboflavin synthase n=1 Tax=Sediminibacterium sp. TaxID=1917865 RepID=UPI00271F10AC|nr:riboflavin synthase [Sediminibacterium sp.]MDO9000417.1 riboflavin synthase [Bacteroidota bacterium]MDP3147015.1 riboflavin synthase [Bacteroidota bacterium]MDP3567448.1 riboflavin synthase [Sediminibacterium sp.]
MFTGIIETLARVEKIEKDGSNVHFTFSCSLTNEFKIDQSVAHNGVCLTVVKITEDNYTVTAIDETLKRTNLNELKVGDFVNLERCMPTNGRFDGHIVQGHVDTTGKCVAINDLNGSWEFAFEHEKNKNFITVEKGSITINGVSLTVVKSTDTTFSVHIIPYTYEHTNFKDLKVGSSINLEFDIIGKYVAKILSQ